MFLSTKTWSEGHQGADCPGERTFPKCSTTATISSPDDCNLDGKGVNLEGRMTGEDIGNNAHQSRGINKQVIKKTMKNTEEQISSA